MSQCQKQQREKNKTLCEEGARAQETTMGEGRNG